MGVLRWLLPSLGAVLTVLATAFSLFTRGAALFAGDGDVGRHVRVGTVILETRSIPHVDLFSHTMAGQPFIPYEWLSETAYALAHQLAGLAGVAVLASLLFGGAVGLVYRATVRMGNAPIVAFAFGILSFLLQATHLLPRPHLFTTFLVAAVYAILLDVRQDGKLIKLLALPPILLIWANLHGGFLLGFILIFFFAADDAFRVWRGSPDASVRRLRALLLIGVACFASTLVNPAGWHLWPHTTGYLKIDFLVDITQEYQSPDFHVLLTRVFLAAILAGVALLAARRSKADLLGATLVIVMTAFGLYSGRNIAVFGVVAVPWLATWTSELVQQWKAEGWTPAERFAAWAAALGEIEASLRPLPLASGAVLLMIALAVRPGQRELYRFSEEKFPVAAVAALSESGQLGKLGRVYNDFTWGGYLLYAAYPEVPVFIDGQTDFYGERLTRDWMTIRDVGPGWRRLLNRYRVEWVLVRSDVALAEALDLIPDRWRLLYRDSVAVAYARNERKE